MDKPLKRHGELFSGKLLNAPNVGGDQKYGHWSLVDPRFSDSQTSRGNIGIVITSDYISFLIKFREIVESGMHVKRKIRSILDLRMESPAFNDFIERNLECDSDFPASFFYCELTSIYGVGIKTAKCLFESGFFTLEELRLASDEAIISAAGISRGVLTKIRMHFRGQGAKK